MRQLHHNFVVFFVCTFIAFVVYIHTSPVVSQSKVASRLVGFLLESSIGKTGSYS